MSSNADIEEVLDTFQRSAVEDAGRATGRVSLDTICSRLALCAASLESSNSTLVQSQIGPERSLDVMKAGLRA